MNNYINKSLWFLPLIIVFGLFSIKSYAVFSAALTDDCPLMAEHFMKGGCNTQCINEYIKRGHPVSLTTAALLMGGVVWVGTDGVEVDARSRGPIPQDVLSIIAVKRGTPSRSVLFASKDAKAIALAFQVAKKLGFDSRDYQEYLSGFFAKFGGGLHPNVWPIMQGNPNACVSSTA